MRMGEKHRRVVVAHTREGNYRARVYIRSVGRIVSVSKEKE